MSIDAGGNSGSQASISIIRIISLNEIRLEKVFRIVFKSSMLQLFVLL